MDISASFLVVLGLGLLAVVVVGVLLLGELRSSRVTEAGKERPETAPGTGSNLEPVWKAIQELQTAHGQIVVAVAQGIEHVDRSERRVRAAVKRAKKRFDDAGFADEGLDAEEEQLYLLDGQLGQEEELPGLSEPVGQDHTRESSPWAVVPGRIA